MEWDYVLQELEALPAEYKEIRFQPLKHVVEVFSSADPPGLTNEIRESGERLGAVLDDIVAAYYTGFARSIHNYSHILSLFADTKSQVASMHSSLTDGRKQLGAHAPLLAEQWCKVRSLKASVELLSEVSALAALPDQVEAALMRKDWPEAVRMVRQGQQALARPDLRKVPALGHVRSSLLSLRTWLQEQMCADLQSRVFIPGRHAEQEEASIRGGAEASKETAAGQRPAGSSIGPQNTARTAAGSAGVSSMGVTEQHHTSLAQLISCLASINALKVAESQLLTTSKAQVRCLLLSTLKRSAAASSQQGDMLRGAGAMAGLGMVAQGMGGHTAETRIGPNAKTCEAAVAAFNACTEVCIQVLSQARNVLKQFTEAKVQAAGSDEGAHRASDPRAAQAHIWNMMQEELVAVVGEVIQALLQRQAPKHEGATVSTDDEALTDGGGNKSFMENLADIVERQFDATTSKLGNILLTATGVTALANLAGSGAGLDGGRLALGPAWQQQHKPDPAQMAKDSKVAWRLELTAPGLAQQVALQVVGEPGLFNAGNTKGSADYAPAVQTVLAGSRGSLYLAPHLHRAIVLLQRNASQTLIQAASRNARGQSKEQGNGWLLESLDYALTHAFLPTAWIELRGRAKAIVEAPNALFPSQSLALAALGPGSLAEAAAASTRVAISIRSSYGRHGLGAAALFANTAMHNLSHWCMLVPALEEPLLAMAHSVVGQVVTAIQSWMLQIMTGYPAGILSARQDVALVQAQEHDARLLGGLSAFYVAHAFVHTAGPGAQQSWRAMPQVQQQEDLVRFLLSAKGQGGQQAPPLVAHMVRPPSSASAGSQSASSTSSMAWRATAATVEVAMVCHQERRVPPDQLLVLAQTGETHTRVQQLAMLSEALMFIADSIVHHFGTDAGDGADALRANVQLQQLWYRCRGLGGACARCLRLDLALLGAHQLATLGLHVTAQARSHDQLGQSMRRDDAGDIPPAVGSLTSLASRCMESLSHVLAPATQAYVAGGLATGAPRMLIWQLEDMPSLAAAGVEQLLRLTMFLQPSMEGLLPSAAAGSTAAANNGVSVSNARSSTQVSAARFTDVQERVAGQFDAARLYYSLLTAAPAEVQRTLATRPYAFTHGEWLTLLQMHLTMRTLPEADVQEAVRAVGAAYGLAHGPGMKVVRALGNVVAAVQAPGEKIKDALLVGRDTLMAGIHLGKDALLAGKDTLLAGLHLGKDTLAAGKDSLLAGVILGKDTLVAGMQIPAQQLQKVFQKLAKRG